MKQWDNRYRSERILWDIQMLIFPEKPKSILFLLYTKFIIDDTDHSWRTEEKNLYYI